MFSPFKHRLAPDIALLALLLLGLFVYLPGISGPFLFDDAHNILTNELVRMDRLELTQILDAIYSAGGQGIPTRGLARLTFALNYYFAGGAYDASAFKLTNILIHLLNTVLVFMLATALLSQGSCAVSRARAKWLALFAAGLWMLHPLQLTSVLYVVQRMTSLSALFVFAGLIIFVHGRARVQCGERHGFLMMAVGIGAGTVLGLLNKENAVLLPFLAYVVHLAFFPVAELHESARQRLRVFHLLFVGLALLVVIIAITRAWPGFLAAFEQVREFSMGERLLTQPRVLIFYLSLFFFPRLGQLSLHHDEFLTSTSLLSPLSTLLAMTVLLLLVAWAFYRLRTGAMWAFAVVFFFVGHSMESSFLPLEMVHEHRNYLPSFAVCLLLASVLDRLVRAVTRPILISGLIGICVLATLGVVTWARVGIWSNERMLAEYMVEQHPDSYRSLSLLAAVQARQQGTVHELFTTYRRIAHANGTAIFPLIRMRRIVAAMQFHLQQGSFSGEIAPAEALVPGQWDPQTLYLDQKHLTQVAAALDTEVLRRLSMAPVSAETVAEFENVRRCLQDQLDLCVGLVDETLGWLRAALAQGTMTDRRRASLLGMLAQHEAATGHMEKAFATLNDARKYAPSDPFLVMHQALLLGRQGRFDEADSMLETLSAGRRHSRADRRSIEASRARLVRSREQASVQGETADASSPQQPE